MMTTTETYHTTFTNSLIDNSTSTIKDEDPSLVVANVTIDELVESCCNEVLPSSSSSSSQLNSSSSVSPTHLVRFVHSQSSLVSQIDDTIINNNTIQQSPLNSIISSHDIQTIKQAPFINVTRIPSPFSTIKPKTIIESTNSMYNTTNLSNITANNISVNNYNVNIHTTNVQQPNQTIVNNNSNDILNKNPNKFDEKQTTEIVSQILKNIKDVDNNIDQPLTANYNIHIDSFNFSSLNEQQSIINKKSRVKKEAKALTRIIVKDDITPQPMSPNFLRHRKTQRNPSTNQLDNSQSSSEYIPVPYGWQRKILAPDLVVYLSPTNAILDSLDAIRQYVESPTTCKCGLQCPLVIEKVFNFDPNIKSKSWEVVQVLEGTHCRQKSNILEMATLTNCIDSFCETEQKPAKRRKRMHNESTNGNVFVCASNIVGNSNNESVVFVNNNNDQSSENGQSMAWTPVKQPNITPPSKRPRGRPRKTAVSSPVINQLAVKPANDTTQIQPVPSSILSPPASVSSISQPNLVHRNSTSPSTHHQNTNLRHINDSVLTPPILSTTTDTNVIARVPSLFDQVKTTTNESTFAVLSGVQNVLLSPNRDANNNDKRIHVESGTSILSTTGKQVTLNVNALKPDFVRSTSVPTKLNSSTPTPNQIDVISLVGTTTNQTQLKLPKTSTTHDDFVPIKPNNDQNNESSHPLMIDFNDPSTTNFLLSALASGASSDSNAIVNHLFQKAQTQQRPITSSSPPTNPQTITIKKTLPIISSGFKTCTETTNLLPSNRPSVVLHVPSTNDSNQPAQSQQIILNHNNNDDKKQHQQIFFINNKPYIIQQKITHDQTSQQRLILTPSIPQQNEPSHANRNVVTVINNSNTCAQSTLDDGGNCLLLNGPVEPKTLRTLLKGLNSSSFSGVDNLIDTINRFEHTTPIVEQNDNILIKSIRSTKKSADKPPAKRRASKKSKQDEQIQAQQQQIQISAPQPMIVEQQQQHQWQTDFNSFDFSTPWGSDTNLNSLLLNDDFDPTISFDDVNFGDFEPYMNGNNNDLTLPSLFVKPLQSDGLPNVDHLLP